MQAMTLQNLASLLGDGSVSDQLYTCAEFNDLTGLKKCLKEKGCDVNYRYRDNSTPLIIASRRRNRSIVRALLNHPGLDADCVWYGNTNCTPLQMWCEEGDLSIVRALVERHGADVNRRNGGGNTCLFSACKHGHTHVVRYLLQSAQANPNVRGILFNTSPLLAAAENGHLEVVQLLVKGGADLNARLDDGTTVLHEGVRNRNLAVVEQLIEYGVSVNVADKAGCTPILQAVLTGRRQLVHVLLEAEAWRSLGAVDSSSKMHAFQAAGLGIIALEQRQAQREGVDTYDEGRGDKVKKEPLEIALALSAELREHFWDTVCVPRGEEEILKAMIEYSLTVGQGTRKPSTYSNVFISLPVWLDTNLLPDSNAGETFAYTSPVAAATPLRCKQDSQQESSQEVRRRGTDVFKQKRFADALTLFETAMGLDQTCVLAVSNAAESALCLNRVPLALKYAGRAVSIDQSHQKSWFRYVRSLARMKRAAEAYVWIAGQQATGAISKSDSIELFSITAAESPLCYGFKKGLYVEKNGDSNYRVRTDVAIKTDECVSKENAVVPWNNELVQDPSRIKHFLNTATPEDIQKLNGLFPRSFDDIPTKVPSLAALEGVVRVYFDKGGLNYSGNRFDTTEACVSQFHPSLRATLLENLEKRGARIHGPCQPPEAEVRELIRGAAVARLCAHDDGIHHFGGFYNHACAPNCEVRGQDNLEIFAIRDIAAGEEICISYLGAREPTVASATGFFISELDQSVYCRSAAMERGWGACCACSLCEKELDEAKIEFNPEREASKDAEAEQRAHEKHGEAAWLEFKKACTKVAQSKTKPTASLSPSLIESALAGTQECGLDFVVRVAKSAIPALQDWDKVHWKETHVLSLFCSAASAELLVSKMVGGKIGPSAARATWQRMEHADALRWVLRRIELRRRYLSVGSEGFQMDNLALKSLLELYLMVGEVKPELGFANSATIRKRLSRLGREPCFDPASASLMIKRPVK